MQKQTYAELMGCKIQPKGTTLADFFEAEHQENEERNAPLRMPINMSPNINIATKKEVLRSIRVKEVEKDNKKLLSVSVIYDLEGREIPMDELESLNHETQHWLTYLGKALWVLSKQNEVKSNEQQ